MRFWWMILCGLLFTTAAYANPAMDGTWRITVMKKGTDKTPIARDVKMLVSFDDDAKTWSATTEKGGKTEKSSGTYTASGEEVVLDRAGAKHRLRVVVKGKQMVMSPVDQPATRLIALKVK